MADKELNTINTLSSQQRDGNQFKYLDLCIQLAMADEEMDAIATPSSQLHVGRSVRCLDPRPGYVQQSS
jgi:hypothetical protein